MHKHAHPLKETYSSTCFILWFLVIILSNITSKNNAVNCVRNYPLVQISIIWLGYVLDFFPDKPLNLLFSMFCLSLIKK